MLTLDTHERWQRVMQGHAVANAVPVVAANRIGEEVNDGVSQRYYGHSFIADHTGEIVASFGEKRGGRAGPQLRSRRDRSATAPTGAFFATAAPTSTARASSSPCASHSSRRSTDP